MTQISSQLPSQIAGATKRIADSVIAQLKSQSKIYLSTKSRSLRTTALSTSAVVLAAYLKDNPFKSKECRLLAHRSYNELVSFASGYKAQEVSPLAFREVSESYIRLVSLAVEGEARKRMDQAKHREESYNEFAGSDDNTQRMLIRNESKRDFVNQFHARGTYLAARAPIVFQAKSNRPITVPDLKKAGFECESLAGYPMLHNQLVLGLSPTWAVKYMKEKVTDYRVSKTVDPKLSKLSKLLKNNSVSLSRQAQSIVNDVTAEYLIELIQTKVNTPLMLVALPHVEAKGLWYWLMPIREIDLLRRVGGSNIKITSWGFAFQGGRMPGAPYEG